MSIASVFDNVPPPLDAFSAENLRQPTLWSLLCCLGYGTAHLVTAQFLVPKTTLAKIAKRADRLYFTEKFFSSLNGLILGSTGTLLFLSGTFSGKDGIFKAYPNILNYVFSSYVGYSLYDMVMMWIVGGEPFEMWAHHALGAFGAFFTMVFRQAAYFPATFMATEITVIPTNILWILRILGTPKDTTAYKISHRSRMISFLVFRSFLAPLCLTYMWFQIDGDAGTKWKTIVTEVKKLPLLVSVGTAFNVTFIGGLNAWWTFLVARGVISRFLGGKKVIKKSD